MSRATTAGALRRSLDSGHRLRSMTVADIDDVMRIEKAAYVVPWSRGNFVDSLASGYLARCLFGERSRLCGYFVAMEGAGEMHLLNLTVAVEEQGRGHARHMLDALVAEAEGRKVEALWLEVRLRNSRARALYRRYGFVEAGLRKGYYPAAPDGPPAREDAVVMRMCLGGSNA